MGRRVAGALACAALSFGAVVLGGPQAGAGPPIGSGSAGGSDPQVPVDNQRPVVASLDRIEPITDRWLRLFVRSPAMGRTVQVQILLPADRSRPRPTLYMLDGRSASNNGNNWARLGGAVKFFADKNVNVVLTVGGPAGYYTDWQRSDPVLGNNKWETFLTSELPPLIDKQFEGNGRKAVEGVSMGAEAAMMLAMRHPGAIARSRHTAVATRWARRSGRRRPGPWCRPTAEIPTTCSAVAPIRTGSRTM